MLVQAVSGGGLASAQYNLGIMYFKGQGVRQNFVTAYMWYIRGSVDGDNLLFRPNNYRALFWICKNYLHQHSDGVKRRVVQCRTQ